jgi:hypothetical protein
VPSEVRLVAKNFIRRGLAARILALALISALIEWITAMATATLFAPIVGAVAMIALDLYLAAGVVAVAEAVFAAGRYARIGARWFPWRDDPVEAVRRLIATSTGIGATLTIFIPAAAQIEIGVARAPNRVVLLGALAIAAGLIGLLCGAVASRWLRSREIARPRRWLALTAGVAILAIAIAYLANRRVIALLDPQLIAAAVSVAVMVGVYPTLARVATPVWLERAAIVAVIALAHLPLGVGPLSTRMQRASYTDILLYGGQSRMIVGAIDAVLPGPALSTTRFPFKQTRPEIGEPLAENMVLITIDTVRADHVSAYGYRRQTTPAIDRFFAGGLRFERCYTASPATVTALYSILYGLYPTRVRWDDKFDPFPAATPPGAPVSRHLRDAGIATHFATFQTYKALHQDFLIGDFDTALSNPDDGAPGEWLTGRDDRLAEALIPMITELDAEPGRHFLWIHFSDPHERYLRHDPPAYFGRKQIDKYDGEIRFTDRAFAKVVAALGATRWGAKAAVMLLSDHGEAFNEHGTTYHGRTSHDEELRVPCWLKVPGREAAVIDTPASTIDVAPTILDVMGVQRGVDFDGVSWGSILRGGEIPERDLFSMVYKRKPIQYAVIRGTRKAIFSPRPRLAAVYDLVADPKETSAIDVGDREIRELTDRLAGWLAATTP